MQSLRSIWHTLDTKPLLSESRLLRFSETPDRVRDLPKPDIREMSLAVPDQSHAKGERRQNLAQAETASRAHDAGVLKTLESTLADTKSHGEWSKSSEQDRQGAFDEGVKVLNGNFRADSRGQWRRASGWGPLRETLEVVFDDGMWQARSVDMFDRAPFVDVTQMLREYRGNDDRVRTALESLARLNQTFTAPLPNPLERRQENGRVSYKYRESSELEYHGKRLVVMKSGTKIVKTDSTGRAALRLAGTLPGMSGCFAAEIDPSTGQARTNSSQSFRELTMQGTDIDALLESTVQDATIGIWVRPTWSLRSNSDASRNTVPFLTIRLQR